MWGTGVVFFLLTFTEANLWLIPAIRNDPVRDITVQWKAYGALFGSWNMLVQWHRALPDEQDLGGRHRFRSRVPKTAFAALFSWIRQPALRLGAPHLRGAGKPVDSQSLPTW